MNNIELVEEFLSKKNLDGIDKFLLEKYIKAVESILNDYKKMEQEIIDNINYLEEQQDNEYDGMVQDFIETLKDLLDKE